MANTKKPKDRTDASEVVNMKDIEVIPQSDRDAAKALIEAAPWVDPSNNAPIDLTKDRLLSVKDVEYLMKVIDVLWVKSTYTPTFLPSTTDQLIKAGMKIEYKDPAHKESVERLMAAYVYRVSRAKYEIFVNENCELESYDSMDLHEKGHILYQHTDGVDLYMKQFAQELDKVWDKVEKWFTEDAKKGIKKDKIVKFIFAQFSNIAQDMEINSKLFENEWIDAKRTMSRSLLVMYYKHLLSQFDELSGLIKSDKARKLGTPQNMRLVEEFKFIVDNLEKRIDGKVDDILFCYPSYYDWPEKMDWFTYLLLLVKTRFDEVMDQIQQMVQAMSAMQGSGQGQSQGQGSGQGQGQGAGGKQISKQNLDDYFDGEDKDEEAKSSGAGESDEDEDEGDEEGENGEGKGTGRSEGGDGRGRGSGAWTGDIETCKTFDQFVKLLRKICMGKELRKQTTDILYYSNRGKTINMGGSIQPRRFVTSKWMPTGLIIQVDISGSVSTDYVERVINAIVDANSGVDLKKSRIIFCDTRVTSDEVLTKRTKKVYSGGGTDMANGMDYIIKKGYLDKPNSKYVLISDFEDNIGDWVKNLERMNPRAVKYLVGYNVHGSNDFDAKKEMSRYVPSNEVGKRLTKLANVLFIEEVIKN